MVDLKHFKKVSSNKTHTTFVHPDGHEIHIAHKALPAEMRSEMKHLPAAKLAQGGEVVSKEPPKEPPKDLSEEQRARLQSIAAGFKKATGFADGTPRGVPSPEVDQQALESLDSYRSDKSRLEDLFKNFSGEQGFARNSGTGLEESATGASSLNAAQVAPAPPTISSPAQDLENPLLPKPQGQVGGQDPFGVQSFEKEYLKGLGEQQTGITGEAEALGQIGQKEAQVANTAANTQQRIQNEFVAHDKDLNSERENLLKDVQDQHIQPQDLFQGKDTLGKIGTAIGIMLGGIAGGMSGQENPVMKYIQGQIDRDLKAQTLELGKKENLLNANMRQFGNLHDATKMTAAMQMDIASLRLKQAAASLQDPLAKARALQQAGVLDQQAAANVRDIAMKKSLLTGGASPEAIVQLIVPKEHQSAAIKELETAQSMVKSKRQFLNGFDQVDKMFLAGTFSPNQKEALLQPNLAQLVKDAEGRITPQDTKMIEALLPARTDTGDTRRLKRQRLEGFIDQKMNFPILKLYGAMPQGNFSPTPRAGKQ